jgi:MFS transporter, putative metabolite:H+ symporter
MAISEPYPAAAPVGNAQLLARMNRLPFTRWHLKARVIMGSATFFDAFDALSLAFVLPVLKDLWHLSNSQSGWLISASYMGQFFGALLFGALAERVGRVRSAAAAIALMSVMAIGCAACRNYEMLLACRFLQGIGVGGEIPVAAAYINEISPAHSRGRFFLLYELIFPIGMVATGQLGTYLVPGLGWKSMFLVGGGCGAIIAFLVLMLRESPRWLMSRGRGREAEAIVNEMESAAGVTSAAMPVATNVEEVPVAKGGWRDIFAPAYRGRTLVVWVLWFCTYLVANGLNNWLPTLYRTVYHLDLKTALRAASMTNITQVILTLGCAFLVDRIGRKPWTLVAYAVAGLLFLILGLGDTTTVGRVGVFATLAYGVLSTVNILLILYTPEIYPTRVRAVGTGIGTAWLRLGSSTGPVLVGWLVGTGTLAPVFLVFAALCAVAFVFATRMIETRERSLEEIAP